MNRLANLSSAMSTGNTPTLFVIPTGSTTDVHTKTAVITPEQRVSDHPMLVNGELIQSSSGLSDPVINPATGAIFDYVPHGSREDLDAAVASA
eukprot:COSAG05_NODE_7497_length_804_cov_1.198582_1_plen_92_part_01